MHVDVEFQNSIESGRHQGKEDTEEWKGKYVDYIVRRNYTSGATFTWK